MKRKQIPIFSDELNRLGIAIKRMTIDPTRMDLQKAHRAEFYIFLLQQKGSFQLMLDFNSVTIKNACLFFIKPGQVHYFLPPKNYGWVLLVSPKIIEKELRAYLDKFATQLVPLKDTRKFANILKLIEETTHLPELNKFKISELYFHINAYVASVCDIFSNSEAKIPNPQSRLNQISAAFKQLLKQHIYTLKKPADYATLLNISTAYLNEILIKTSGFSTSYWIRQELFLEAKRLLYHTELTSKEIAFELGFEDHNYFTRLFKKINGLTPIDFRKAYHDLSR